jgi:hypothetical protein
LSITLPDSQKSEIGLLYGIIAKVRVLIMMKEMIQAGWLAEELFEPAEVAG